MTNVQINLLINKVSLRRRPIGSIKTKKMVHGGALKGADDIHGEDARNTCNK
jgi:hypothetical protein